MNDIVDAIEASFKELLKDRRYRSITVKDICAQAHISRNAFYGAFHDKRAVVAYLFRRDAVEPFRRAVDAVTFEVAHQLSPVILQRFYQGIFDNREYYYNLVAPMCGTDPTFELVVARGVYKPMRDAMKVRGFVGREIEADYIAYYYAAAQAIFLEKWISDGFELSVEGIAALYSSLVTDHTGRLFSVTQSRL